MNNNDFSNLMNLINKMDKTQLNNGISQLNKILSDEDKKKLIQTLNDFQNKNNK